MELNIFSKAAELYNKKYFRKYNIDKYGIFSYLKPNTRAEVLLISANQTFSQLGMLNTKENIKLSYEILKTCVEAIANIDKEQIYDRSKALENIISKLSIIKEKLKNSEFKEEFHFVRYLFFICRFWSMVCDSEFRSANLFSHVQSLNHMFNSTEYTPFELVEVNLLKEKIEERLNKHLFSYFNKFKKILFFNI